MVIIFQILFAAFSLFVISVVLRRRSEGLISMRAAGFWVLFWLATITAVIWPNSTMFIAQSLGIGRGADVVVYVSLALMFYIMFQLHIKIERIRRDVTAVVRRDALDAHGVPQKHAEPRESREPRA